MLIIDMSRLLDPKFSEEETAKLGSACEHWGFFQLVNHGVDAGLLRQLKVDITDFFRLPLEEKLAVAIQLNGVQGDTLDKYSTELATLASQLLKVMANYLGVDQESLLDMFKGHPQSVRINYYPPCREADKVLGLSPHTDGGGMTFLLHVNDVEGLQIKNDGKWFSVQSMPGAIVVNIGDTLEILTNGKYKSIEHKAVINPKKERITIAAFQIPDHLCMIRPLQELLEADKARYKEIDAVEFLKGYVSAKLDGRRYLESLKLGI